jgi:hypothetical protein
MLAAPVVLGRRFRDDSDWAALSRPVEALALRGAVAFAIFVSRVAEPQNGLVQRIAVTLPLIAEALIAARLPTLPQAPGAGGIAPDRTVVAHRLPSAAPGRLSA